MADQSLVPAKNENKAPATLALGQLTARNRKFIAFLFQGLSSVDAYKAAGYKGKDHAAYVLRCEMRPYLEQYCEANGLDKAGLMVDLAKLGSLPVVDASGQPLKNVTLAQKLKLMKLHKELADSSKHGATSITAIVIGRGTDGKTTVAVPAEKVQDAEVIPSENPTPPPVQ